MAKVRKRTRAEERRFNLRGLWLFQSLFVGLVVGVFSWGVLSLVLNPPPPEDAVSTSAKPAKTSVVETGAAQAPTLRLASPTAPIATGISRQGVELHRRFRAYALSRVVELTYTTRGALRFSGWEAHDDFDATEADSQGRLTQWEEGWFVAHDWSWFGQQILGMIPGDIVHVNGHEILVEGIFDYPKESYSNEIHEVAGYGKLILQTCEPNQDLNRIVYGRDLAE